MKSKVAAACVQMDSWQLLAVNVAHLLTQGIQDFYILNHYCKEDFRGNLEKIFGQQAKFRWFTKSSQPFFQSTMTTFLVHQAKREGFDYLVVFDADEFFTPKGNHSTLARAIPEEMGNHSHLRVSVQDFMVEGVHQRFSLGSLGDAQPNPIDKNTRPKSQMGLVSFPKISLRRMGKVIINLKRWRTKDFVPTGNHFGSGLGKNSREVTLLHLPFWSKESISQRLVHVENLDATSATQGVGIHLRQFSLVHPEDFWSSKTWSRQVSGPSRNHIPIPSKTIFNVIRERVSLQFPALEKLDDIFKASVPTNSLAPDVSEELDNEGPHALLIDGGTFSALIIRLFRILSRIEISFGRGGGSQV
jgi:hypothetical protein